MEYRPHEVEEKWQRIWEGVSRREKGEKRYILVMFPYPSGRIHMGHVRNYTIGDAVARYFSMKGYDVFHPMGWDAFGLPAENAAIEHGIHPAKWTYENIKFMRNQLKRLGFSYDWSAEIATCDPDYYRWEQEFFIKMLERGLAYRKKSLVNFCTGCETVLANEQVVGWRCWRCESTVVKKEMWGWFFKITAYAEELLEGLKELEWPESVKRMQEEWIGKSEGAQIKFPSEIGDIEIFTTRPDTVFGITFMALSPEHELSKKVAKENKEAEKFIERILMMDKEERGRTLEGMFTGKYAVNPFTGDKVPIWITTYVLPDYGTGAIMCVPAHDSRDFAFAKKYDIPVKFVVKGNGVSLDSAYEGEGILVNSGLFSGMSSYEAKRKITKYANEKGFGEFSVSYRLRDWGISRQRYWGAPIPVVFCSKCGTVPEKKLPVILPEDVDIGKGGSPLERVDSFVNTKCPECGADARRETDTMDTFVESSWYFLGYLSRDLKKEPFELSAIRRYLPVDIYIGGIEHAVLHLLYARFFTKVLRDLGYIDFSEPFKFLLTQGMVIKDGAKMSKSRGNIVDPDDIVTKYGADTARIFILFAAPPEKDLDWSDRGVEGASRFLTRVFRILGEFKGHDSFREEELSQDVLKALKATHKTIKKVTDDIERMHFNTAIASLMELLNVLSAIHPRTDDDHACLRQIGLIYSKLLVPFAPHAAEELWRTLGGQGLVTEAKWPIWEEKFLVEERIKLPVQVNGKLRGEIEVNLDASDEEVLEEARKKVAKYIEGRSIKKTIYIKGKILNLVVG